MSVYYNDNKYFCAQVLCMNIQRGMLPEGTIDERSITEIHASDFVGYQHVHLFAGIGGFPYGLALAGFPQSIRVLTGGFPCTDISNAGKRAGITGKQSGLWSEMYRLIEESIDCGRRFDYILIENVAALTGRGLDTILTDFAKIRYDAQWFCIRASDVGATHERDRIFIVAYPCRPRQKERNITTFTENTRYVAGVYDQAGVRRQFKSILCGVLDGLSSWMDRYRWPTSPDEKQQTWEQPRVISEKLPYRTHRIEALGNAIVPQIVAEIGKCILAYHEAA